MGIILILIGFIIGLIFALQILILAFKESRVWFIGSLIIPLVMLIFVIMHWEKAKSPFLKGLIAIPFYVIGFIMVGSSTQ
jgi:F0F1-type ATP synthase assembly protein I